MVFLLFDSFRHLGGPRGQSLDILLFLYFIKSFVFDKHLCWLSLCDSSALGLLTQGEKLEVKIKVTFKKCYSIFSIYADLLPTIHQKTFIFWQLAGYHLTVSNTRIHTQRWG